MKRSVPAAILAAILAVALATPAVAAPLTLPTRVVDGFTHSAPPTVTAAAWLVYDESTDSILASRLATQERSIASVTKIMTVLVALENSDPAETVTVSKRAADTGEREIDLFAGEEISLEALIKAALIHSANDAATAIAEHVGGSVEGFVDMMNSKAAEMGLTETSFANPHGLDAPGHYSSAADLLTMTLAAMQNPVFREIVKSRALVFPDAPDGSSRIGQATNLMLHDYEGMSGVKTGFTSQALLTMVASAERGGRRLYAVVLGSDGRRAHFADVKLLFDWAFESLGIYGVLGTGDDYVSVKTRVEPRPLVAAANTETLIHLAGQGLLTDPPQTLVNQPPPAPPPIVTVERRPETGETELASLGYWWRLLTGD